jgi:hypothetical protein
MRRSLFPYVGPGKAEPFRTEGGKAAKSIPLTAEAAQLLLVRSVTFM